MKYLLDANILLEFILEQQDAKKAGQLLEKMSDQFCISYLALCSIGMIVSRRGNPSGFLDIVDDIVRTGTILVQLDLLDMKKLVEIMQTYTLDFDDAYQYAIAEKYNLAIVSYDTDFNRTPRGRTTPAALLQTFAQQTED